MELSVERINKNFDKFCVTGKKYKFITDELIDFLGDDLRVAPASTLTSLHNAFEGGLIDHILTVTKFAVNLNNTLPANMKVNEESLIKVCFLHQIGKVGLYIKEESKWHRENQGKMYKFNEEVISMRVGERSAYYSLSYGVNLSDTEYQAIISFDKSDDDKMSKWHSNMLTVVLRQGIELAIIEETING